MQRISHSSSCPLVSPTNCSLKNSSLLSKQVQPLMVFSVAVQLGSRVLSHMLLKAKLLELRERAKEEEMANIKGEMKKIEWGSQIRSYVFQPYTMVKDHRTNYESGNIDDVMDGNLEGFITAYLKMQ